MPVATLMVGFLNCRTMFRLFDIRSKELAFQKGSVIKNDLKKPEIGLMGTGKRLLTVMTTSITRFDKL